MGQEDMKTELSIQYDKFVNLTDLIIQVNSMFEVYTFFLVGTNIPITIFVTVNFFRTKVLIFKLINLWGSVLCMLELFILIMWVLRQKHKLVKFRPAGRIYASLKLVEINVSSNKRIWLSINEENYPIAFAIVEHARLEIGLTLWGFATMTKGMILTVCFIWVMII
jgi:hypothetical protein